MASPRRGARLGWAAVGAIVLLVRPCAGEDVARPEPTALVVEVAIEARDTVPLRAAHQLHSASPAGVIEATAALLNPAFPGWLQSRKPPPQVRIGPEVQQPADIDVIVLEHRNYLGEFRRAQVSTFGVFHGLPVFPRGEPARELLITPFGSRPSAFDILTWPQAEWRLEDAGSGESALILESGDEHIRLRPGEAHEFAPRESTVAVTLGRFEPVKVGDTSEPKPIETDLGEATFTTAVTIRFLGPRLLRIGQ